MNLTAIFSTMLDTRRAFASILKKKKKIFQINCTENNKRIESFSYGF